MMELAGESLCAGEDAETTSVTMLAGAFRMAVQLPQGANIEGTPFSDMIKSSLAEGLGLWPTDFSRFTIERTEASSQQRRLGGPRRLSTFTFDVSYELMVRDLAKLGRLQRDLNSMGSEGSALSLSFSRALLANGCQVLSLFVTRAPTHFQGTVLLPKQGQGSSSMLMAQDVEQGSALNTSTIAGGFIGAMMGLTIVTAVLYMVTRKRRKAAG